MGLKFFQEVIKKKIKKSGFTFMRMLFLKYADKFAEQKDLYVTSAYLEFQESHRVKDNKNKHSSRRRAILDYDHVPKRNDKEIRLMNTLRN